MDCPASFGHWLKLRRKVLDLTQDELARAADAARRWSAAAALHAVAGTAVWPADRREQPRYQALARPQLEAVAWDAAWQQGWADPRAAQPTLLRSK